MSRIIHENPPINYMRCGTDLFTVVLIFVVLSVINFSFLRSLYRNLGIFQFNDGKILIRELRKTLTPKTQTKVTVSKFIRNF